MGRGANWTSNDDVEMCKSWLHISTDSLTGKDQKFTHFWEKIMRHMRKAVKVDDADHTLRAAQCRFGLISAAVSKFVSAFAKAQRTAPSGTNLVDMERRAMEIYRLEHAAGKAFEFRECWLVLRTNPKWQMHVATLPIPIHVQAPSADMGETSSPESQVPTPYVSEDSENQGTPVTMRPVGIKRAKLDIKQAKERDRVVQAIQTANLLATKRQRILEDQVALGYFKLQDQDVAPKLREIFLRRRARLLREMDEGELPTSLEQTVDLEVGNEAIPEGPIAGQEAGESLQGGEDDDMFCYGAENPQVQEHTRSYNPNTNMEYMFDEQVSHQGDTVGAQFTRLQDIDVTIGEARVLFK